MRKSTDEVEDDKVKVTQKCLLMRDGIERYVDFPSQKMPPKLRAKHKKEPSVPKEEDKIEEALEFEGKP